MFNTEHAEEGSFNLFVWELLNLFLLKIRRLYIFIYLFIWSYSAGILQTAKEEFHCTEKHVSIVRVTINTLNLECVWGCLFFCDTLYTVSWNKQTDVCGSINNAPLTTDGDWCWWWFAFWFSFLHLFISQHWRCESAAPVLEKKKKNTQKSVHVRACVRACERGGGRMCWVKSN